MLLRSQCAGAVLSLILHVVLVVALAAFLIASGDVGPMFDIQSAGLAGPTQLQVAIQEPTWVSNPSSELSSSASIALPNHTTSEVSSALRPGDSFWDQRSRQIAGLGLSEEASSGGEKAGGQKAAAAEFFGVQASGKRIVYVVDCSLSMRGPRWRAAREELVRSLRALKRDVSFLVVFFSDDCYPMPGSTLQLATPGNIEIAANWIESTSLGWGTKPLASVQLAYAQEPDAIFLLTDGEFADRTAKFLRDENSEKGPKMASVHTIAFQSRDGIRLLKRIARENSGQFRYVPAGS